MSTGLCARVNNCQKVDVILDQDILDFQAAELLSATCQRCPEPKDVIAMCNLSDRGDCCVGGLCPMFLRCWLPPTGVTKA